MQPEGWDYSINGSRIFCKALRPFLILGLLFLLLGSMATAQTPTVFFTDVVSGPNSGGENNWGTILTVYGKNFGAVQGTSTLTLGGGLVAHVYQWGVAAPSGAGLQMISAGIGSAAATGPVIVSTPAGASNSNVTFTVRTGTIRCVSTAGADTNDGKFPTDPSSGTHGCWRQLIKAKSGMGNGDITYAQNGVSTSGPDDSWDAAYTIRSTHYGAAGAPKALVAYPGATVQIGAFTGTSPSNGIRFADKGSSIYLVFAGLNLISRNGGEAMALDGDGDIRIVGNSMTCVNATTPAGCLGTGELVTTNFNYILGNYVHDVGSTTPSSSSKFFHSVYLGDGSNHLEFGWNTVANNQANRAVQVFTGSADQFDMRIHDNFINVSRGVGFVLNGLDASKGPVAVFNNVIYRAGVGPDFNDGGNVADCVEFISIDAGTLNFYNNTLADCGSQAGAGGGAFGFDSNFAGQVAMKNNIIYLTSGERYFATTPQSANATSCDHNLWFGGGSIPSFCNTSSINVNPLFVNGTSNLHLLSNSPAIGTGTSLLSSQLDFDGLIRPSPPSIGAYEFTSGTVVLRPNPPTNLLVTVH